MEPIKLFSRIVLTLAMLIVLFGLGTSSVQAYGNTALWQIGLSANCNNPSICGDETGGFWGWVEFDQNGQGDATLSGCGHLVAAGPAHVAGASYFSLDITNWTIGPGSAGLNTFIVLSGTETFKGKYTGTVPITEPLDTGIPAKAGHFNTQDMLGLSAPGVSFQVQVVQLH
jgi:hypothetical protein